MARRLDKAALFEMLGYEPHPGQLVVHKSKAPRRVMACGVRLGKTTCGAMEAIAALLQPCRSSIGWIVGPNYSHANRIFEHVAAIVQTKLSHRVLELCPREHRMILCNLSGGRSEMRAKTADNSASLLGEGLDWLVVDEAARLNASIWEQHLSQRLIDKKGWALLLSTPRGTDWFYKLYKRGQKNRDPSFESWAMPSSVNPHLDKDLIEAERARLGEDVFGQEYEAQFIGALQEPCDVCGGPSPDVPGVVVVHGHIEPPQCLACHQATDEHGRTVVNLAPNGTPMLRVLQLIQFRPGDIIEHLPGMPEDPDDPASRLGWEGSDPGPAAGRPHVDPDFFKSPASS